MENFDAREQTPTVIGRIRKPVMGEAAGKTDEFQLAVLIQIVNEHWINLIGNARLAFLIIFEQAELREIGYAWVDDMYICVIESNYDGPFFEVVNTYCVV